MATTRWDRTRATRMVDPMAVDEAAGGVVVVEGVTAADDPALGWCRTAPAVVVGLVGAGRRPPAAVDVALVGEERALLDTLVDRVERNPQASRVLVDVLRVVEHLDVAAGLTVESLGYSTLLGGAEFGGWLAARTAPAPRPVAGPPLRLVRRGPVLEITLSRPERRNAFSAELRDALVEALVPALLDDSIRSVRIRAEGPLFSAGGDLGEFGTTPDPAHAHEIRTRRSVGALLAGLGDRVVVEVHGTCVGAGVELPAFAHRVVAAPDTTFRLPEVAMGLIPGAGGTVSVTRRIGRQRSARFALTGETLDAPTALRWGLVDEVSP